MKSAQRADEVTVDRAYRGFPLADGAREGLPGPTRTPPGATATSSKATGPWRRRAISA
jgi:hypothetical protein